VPTFRSASVRTVETVRCLKNQMRRPGATTLILVFVFAGLAGCSTGIDPNDRSLRALGYEAGRSETELIRDVGQPTSQRRVGEGPTVDLCDEPAYRELTYETQTVGFTKLVLDTFGRSSGQFTIVCVDKDGRITQTNQLIVD
jgi:hypothetical protein